jgi:deazaflavin-dependent oxidoreductase (nitroreductase family)
MMTSESMRTTTVAAIPLRIRVLRRLNPLVIGVLGSRLHGLASGDILILRVAGRRSGCVYTLPLSYVERDGVLYLCSRPEGSVWWRNLVDGADVEITWRGRPTAARARVLVADSVEALDGLRAFLTRNPGTGRLLYNVSTASDGRPNESDLVREVARSVVVRIDPVVR